PPSNCWPTRAGCPRCSACPSLRARERRRRKSTSLEMAPGRDTARFYAQKFCRTCGAAAVGRYKKGSASIRSLERPRLDRDPLDCNAGDRVGQWAQSPGVSRKIRERCARPLGAAVLALPLCLGPINTMKANPMSLTTWRMNLTVRVEQEAMQ